VLYIPGTVGKQTEALVVPDEGVEEIGVKVLDCLLERRGEEDVLLAVAVTGRIGVVVPRGSNEYLLVIDDGAERSVVDDPGPLDYLLAVGIGGVVAGGLKVEYDEVVEAGGRRCSALSTMNIRWEGMK